MGNMFTDFVKEYAKKNNMTYFQAISEASKEWKKVKQEMKEALKFISMFEEME